MNLKMRPISEAPRGKRLLIIRASGEHTAISLPAGNDRVKIEWAQTPGVQGFYEISDLIRAAEILAAITPEGCELLPELIHAPDDPKACISLHPDLHVRVKIRKLAPPVEYRYECEAEPREARIGDWIRSDDKWVEVKKFGFLREPRLCYTRREVKR